MLFPLELIFMAIIEFSPIEHGAFGEPTKMSLSFTRVSAT